MGRFTSSACLFICLILGKWVIDSICILSLTLKALNINLYCEISIYGKFTDVIVIFNIKGKHMMVAGDRVRECELSLDEMAAADGVILSDKWLYNSVHIWMITDQMNFAPQSIWPIDEVTLHSTDIDPTASAEMIWTSDVTENQLYNYE